MKECHVKFEPNAEVMGKRFPWRISFPGTLGEIIFHYQSDAWERGNDEARRRKGRVILHKRNGEIREVRNYE